VTEAEQGGYPRQVAIDAYGKGGFRFEGISHRGSLLCLPSGMRAWPVSGPGEVTLATLAPLLDEADRMDVLFIGLGTEIVRLDPAIAAAFRERGVIVEAIATGGAVRTYNVLLAEDRAVGAALIAVDRVR
jgi:uncharacterized protein